MWAVNGIDMKMCEGDWGIILPTKISGTTFTEHDEILFTLKDGLNGNTVLTKTFTGITDNTFNFSLTEAESALLPVGSYCYSLDWYQDGAFMCNVVECGQFKVGDKA